MPEEPHLQSESAQHQAALTAFQSGDASTGDDLLDALQDEVGRHFQPAYSRVPKGQRAGSPRSAVFRCTNLTKSYGQGSSYNEVIKGIDFTVSKGEYVVIYGPSGSGKSTLLNLLAGLEEPSRGEISVRGKVLNTFSDDQSTRYHRHTIGLVFQNFNLLASQRVWENVAFPLLLDGVSAAERQRTALALLQRFTMQDYASYYPHQLSGGQQQRVALARALVQNPDILLVDEPTGNLDSASAGLVMEEIQRLHREGRTIILVTHSTDFLQYATRVFYIRDGVLLTSNE